jgi:holo-[acyl-carrier protein] synthase
MNILGIGTDIVDIRRLTTSRSLAQIGRFFFVRQELRDMKKSSDQAQFLASRLAAKEAIIKAYPGVLHYHDVVLYKKAKKLQARLTRKKDAHLHVFVSIAHEFNYAIGYAIVGA